MEVISEFLALCEGNPPDIRPMQIFYVFFIVSTSILTNGWVANNLLYHDAHMKSL